MAKLFCFTMEKTLISCDFNNELPQKFQQLFGEKDSQKYLTALSLTPQQKIERQQIITQYVTEQLERTHAIINQIPLLNTLREILALNNYIAIISSTPFPEIIPLVLESIGLKAYEIAMIKFIFAPPIVLATGTHTAPIVKNQQLASAQNIFPGHYFHNTDIMLIDYQQASTEAAISAGYQAVQAPSLHNFPRQDFAREAHRRIHAFHPFGEEHLNDTRYLQEIQNMNKQVALTPKGFLGKDFISSRARVLYSNHEKELLKALKGLLLRELEAYRAQILINPNNAEFIADYNHARDYYLEILKMHRDFRRIVYGGNKPTSSMQIEEPAHQDFMRKLDNILNPFNGREITFSAFV